MKPTARESTETSFTPTKAQLLVRWFFARRDRNPHRSSHAVPWPELDGSVEILSADESAAFASRIGIDGAAAVAAKVDDLARIMEERAE